MNVAASAVIEVIAAVAMQVITPPSCWRSCFPSSAERRKPPGVSLNSKKSNKKLIEKEKLRVTLLTEGKHGRCAKWFEAWDKETEAIKPSTVVLDPDGNIDCHLAKAGKGTPDEIVKKLPELQKDYTARKVPPRK